METEACSDLKCSAEERERVQGAGRKAGNQQGKERGKHRGHRAEERPRGGNKPNVEFSKVWYGLTSTFLPKSQIGMVHVTVKGGHAINLSDKYQSASPSSPAHGPHHSGLSLLDLVSHSAWTRGCRQVHSGLGSAVVPHNGGRRWKSMRGGFSLIEMDFKTIPLQGHLGSAVG